MGLSDLEFLATAIVLMAVFEIGALRIRGQYLMLAAQVTWGLWAAFAGAWFLFAQSCVLFVLTLRAIRIWGRA